MKLIHVVSFSGGKDSQATLDIAIKRFGKKNVIAIFCDTGNEHEEVYRHIDYVSMAYDTPIIRLRADFSEQIANKRMFIARDQRTGRDKSGRRLRWTNKAKRRALSVLHPTGNPFLDLCLWKGRFPSRKAQFCTEELKRNIAVEFQLALIDLGYTVVSWQGVRRDESEARKNVAKFERLDANLYVYRPIAEWTAAAVFAHIKESGVLPNPLYKKGFHRVGCMPCINARKAEVREINARFPSEINRIDEWERLVSQASKRGIPTFFPAIEIKDIQNKMAGAKQHNIWSVVEWSKTTRGGKQYDLLASIENTGCSSSYGLCDQEAV